jgi:hypothetical protein
MLNEIIQAFSSTIGTVLTSGIAIAALAWLAKKIIALYLSKDIAAYKAKLDADSAIVIEKLRNSLSQIAYEHQVVFGHLHEKRMGAIQDLHSELIDIKRAVEKVVSPFQGPEFHKVRHENASNALTKATQFYELFDKRKLFLDEKLAGQMDAFVRELYKLVLKFNTEMNLATSPDPSMKYGSYIEVWSKTWESFENQFVPILGSLESQFRILLGVGAKGSQSSIEAPMPSKINS